MLVVGTLKIYFSLCVYVCMLMLNFLMLTEYTHTHTHVYMDPSNFTFMLMPEQCTKCHLLSYSISSFEVSSFLEPQAHMFMAGLEDRKLKYFGCLCSYLSLSYRPASKTQHVIYVLRTKL